MTLAQCSSQFPYKSAIDLSLQQLQQPSHIKKTSLELLCAPVGGVFGATALVNHCQK